MIRYDMKCPSQPNYWLVQITQHSPQITYIPVYNMTCCYLHRTSPHTALHVHETEAESSAETCKWLRVKSLHGFQSISLATIDNGSGTQPFSVIMHHEWIAQLSHSCQTAYKLLHSLPLSTTLDSTQNNRSLSCFICQTTHHWRLTGWSLLNTAVCNSTHKTHNHDISVATIIQQYKQTSSKLENKSTG